MPGQNNTDGNLALRGKERRVITIDATERPEELKLRVAAYARVSTDSDDQQNSFAAQNQYYSKLISENRNWTMVDIYADLGVTGTSAEKRDDFQRMLTDCRRGKIDRILCKSISRFARNTKECLEIIRELKNHGIGVQFEKEHIDTSRVNGEMLTAMLASLAQAESESISGNMRWSYQNRMYKGEYVTSHAPYGYRLKNSQLVIFEPEAQIVRMIFSRYLAGDSVDYIAEILNAFKIPTISGPRWKHQRLTYILKNEKYIGNALVQKTYATDTFPYRRVKNSGEKPMYLVTGNHQPIVDIEIFNYAQKLLKNRAERLPEQRVQVYPLTRKIVCGKCGSTFKRRIIKGKVYWGCYKHEYSADPCPMSQIAEANVYLSFLQLYNKLIKSGTAILLSMLSHLRKMHSYRLLWTPDVIELNKKISQITSQNQLLATLKQQGAVDPDIFIAKTNRLSEQLRAAKLEKERLMDTTEEELYVQTQELLDVLASGPDFLDTFDEELFGELVDKIIVESNQRLRFRLKNGLELAEPIEKKGR